VSAEGVHFRVWAPAHDEVAVTIEGRDLPLLGPDGCYLKHFTPSYFTKRYVNEWGEAVNLDGEEAHGVRELFAMTALLLLQPQTPMLFQGQEFAASAPFLYFADHRGELAESVRKGRYEFMQQFASIRGLALDAPEDPETFARCKLDHAERETHADVVALHRELLRLRRTMPFDAELRGSVLAESCLALRWLAAGARARLLLVNLGRDLHLDPAPDPLLAPPEGFPRWRVLWASEPFPEPETDENWRIAGEAAMLLEPAVDWRAG
jgi:maltooligosyltrehalose trehalohydrolase